MPVLKGLEGLTGMISVGNSFKSFANIGNAPKQVIQAVSGLKMVVLSDSTEPDSISIVTQPSVGRAISRKDGKISVDFLGYDPDENTDQLVVYDRVKNGVTSRVEQTLTVTPAEKKAGWDDGAFYNLEWDRSTGLTIVEPTEGIRKIYVTPENGNGHTRASIATAESLSEGAITDAWLEDNKATGSDFYYGETEALALVESVARPLFGRLKKKENASSLWALFERGGVYSTQFNMKEGRGYSALHPTYFGTWGTGDAPSNTAVRGFAGEANKGVQFFVMQSLHNQKVYLDGYISHSIIDDFATEGIYGSYEVEGGIKNTLRNFKLLDSARTEPVNMPSNTWRQGYDNRTHAIFISYASGNFLENGFVDHAGWTDGYRADGAYYDPVLDEYYGQHPQDTSHDIYWQFGCAGSYIKDVILSRSALSGAQLRSNGIGQRVVSVSNNNGFTIAGAEKLYNPEGEDYYAKGNAATFGFFDQFLVTSGGFRAIYGNEEKPVDSPNHQAVGFNIGQDFDLGFQRCLIANIDYDRSDLNLLEDGNSIGPCCDVDWLEGRETYQFPLNTLGGGNYNQYWITPLDLEQYDFQIVKWGTTFPDYNVDGIDQSIKDGTTVGAYNDQKASTTGSEMVDLVERLRGLDKPWEETLEIINWNRARMGATDAVVRTVAQTVTFAPFNKYSPGNQAHTELDWDTWDEPGTVGGDSVDLDGHSIAWNITPKNDLDDFTFGFGSTCRVVAGILEPTGDIIVDVGGNTFTAENGGKLYIPGYSGSGPLAVDACDGRFMNKGTVAGNVSINAHYRSEVVLAWDTGSFVVSDGETLTVYGDSKVGFDGTGGGAVSSTFEAGSTLAFKPSARVYLDQLASNGYRPKEGTMLTDETSGATGIVREMQLRIGEFMTILDNITGVFSVDDVVSGDTIRFVNVGAYGVDSQAGYQESYAEVVETTAAPVYTLGTIREFPTGINGFTADKITPPDVDSTVTLGGTLHLDVTGMANGTYTLIDVDTVSGTFDAVTAAGNSAKDLTVSITGTTVTVLIEDGDGTTTGGTS